MTCSYCATALPPDALFCGECGRAVTRKSPQGVRAGLPPLTTPLPQPEPWINSSANDVCEQCGLPVEPDDIFCGECGFVVTSAVPSAARPSDTDAIERLERVEPDEQEPKPEPE